MIDGSTKPDFIYGKPHSSRTSDIRIKLQDEPALPCPAQNKLGLAKASVEIFVICQT